MTKTQLRDILTLSPLLHTLLSFLHQQDGVNDILFFKYSRPSEARDLSNKDYFGKGTICQVYHSLLDMETAAGGLVALLVLTKAHPC